MNSSLSPASEKKTIRIMFVDGVDTIDGGLSPQRIRAMLEQRYHIIEDAEHPDFLFYTHYGYEHLRYADSVRIFIGYENTAPDFTICDYAVSCIRLIFGKRSLWYPIALWNQQLHALPRLSDEAALNRDFCAFIFKQESMGEGAKLRKELAQALMKDYRFVHCPGRVLHNTEAPELAARGDMNHWQESKMRYLSRFKFNIAYENSNTPGYISEKLMDCYKAGCVPIYWGSEGDIAPFPKESMIYACDYPNVQDLVARIQEVDSNDELYLSMLHANPLYTQQTLPSEKDLQDFLFRIIEQGNRPFDKDSYGVADSTRLLKAAWGRPALYGRLLLACFQAVWAIITRNRPLLSQCGAWRFCCLRSLRLAAFLRRLRYKQF